MTKVCFITDHNIEWGGDGYYCLECDSRFLLQATEKQLAKLQEELLDE